MGKAGTPRDSIDSLIKTRKDIKKQYGIERQNYSGVSGPAVGNLGGSGGAENGLDINSFITKAKGGQIIQHIAFFPKTIEVSTGSVDLTDSSAGNFGNNSTNINVIGEGNAPDDVTTITAGVEGQILILKAAGYQITIKDGTGNIVTPSNIDYVIEDDEGVILIYDVAGGAGTPRWMVLGGTGAGGGADNLGDHTATQDLQMSANDIIGVANIDLDGVAATIEGVVNLQFYNTSHSINSIAGTMLYQVNTAEIHQFTVAAASKLRITSSAIEMDTAVDMNDNDIVQVQKIEFSNSTSDFINSTVNGIVYDVNSTDEHFFNVAGTTVMTVDSNKVEFAQDIDMNSNDINEINHLQFTVSGQEIQTGATRLNYQVPSGDTHGFFVAGTLIAEISDQGLEITTNDDLILSSSSYIEFGSTSVSAGSLAGYLWVKLPGGTFKKIAYYDTA